MIVSLKGTARTFLCLAQSVQLAVETHGPYTSSGSRVEESGHTHD